MYTEVDSEVIFMHDKQKDTEKDKNKHHDKYKDHHVKHQAAEAVEQSQWRKHPGGG